MTRAIASLLGIGILIGGGILLVRLLQPTEPATPPKPTAVLTGAYAPVLVDSAVLQDHELPAGLEPPGVGSDTIYLQIVIQYPGAANVPDPEKHHLDHVRGGGAPTLSPVDIDTWEGEGGAMLALVFRTLNTFESARLVRGTAVILADFRID